MQKENIWRCKDCAFMVNRQQQAEQHKLLCPITNSAEDLAQRTVTIKTKDETLKWTGQSIMPERRKLPKKRNLSETTQAPAQWQPEPETSVSIDEALAVTPYRPSRTLKRRKPEYQSSMDNFVVKKDEEPSLPLSPKSVVSEKTKEADITIIVDEDDDVQKIEEINENSNDQNATDENSKDYKIGQVMTVCGVSKEIAVEALERNNYDMIETFQDL